jgi:6-pyruvoyltetrahydropterin/6-carboxytetrahydropterin synthase
MSHTTLHIYKQNLKFSSAHFLIFDEKNAEKLHGHNYQVSVAIAVPKSAGQGKSGYFINFKVFKEYIKSACDRWDEHVLLPADNPEMKIQKKGKSLEVNFRDRFYVFPANEVCQLPVTNTSVEQLSKLLAEDFLKEFGRYGVSRLTVKVEETKGQGASTTAHQEG